jgi:hypothetical protein
LSDISRHSAESSVAAPAPATLPTANRQPPTANWLIAAALSAWACQIAVQHATPIDRALPLIAIAVTLLAAVSYPAVMIGVPLLVVIELAPLIDEGSRLLAMGIVVSCALGVAVSRSRTLNSQLTTIVAIFLLRWIPIANVEPIRELFLMAVALAIVFVLGRTPLAVTIAVVTALITPAFPLRTLAVPLLVLFVAVLARYFGMPRVQWTWPSAIVLGFVMLFFPWSGIVARAFPYFLQRAQPSRVTEETWVGRALPANERLTLDVPPDARALIVSGANVAKMRRGTVLGRIAPLGVVRIGDCSDWGYMRREHFYDAHNPLPRNAAGRIHDHGYAAWVDGAGRLPLPPGTRRIVVTADAALPPGASLQVEGFE